MFLDKECLMAQELQMPLVSLIP